MTNTESETMTSNANEIEGLALGDTVTITGNNDPEQGPYHFIEIGTRAEVTGFNDEYVYVKGVDAIGVGPVTQQILLSDVEVRA